jgi:hypothetical protein
MPLCYVKLDWDPSFVEAADDPTINNEQT